MCGCGAGETGGNRFCGGSQLRQCGDQRAASPLWRGQGSSALLGSRGNAIRRVQGVSACAECQGGEPLLRYPGVGKPRPGKVDACVNFPGFYLTQTFAGFAVSPPFPGPGTSSQEGGKLFETDTTQRALRQASHLQSPTTMTPF